MTREGDYVRHTLRHTVESAGRRGMPRMELRGQLIRPTLAYAAASSCDVSVPPEFWSGALAIQYAHEASLVHDDIVDESEVRRGEQTVSAIHGIGKALVYGDHLLTASYRLAAETGSPEFVTLFARCVERTVAGEIMQAKSLGRKLSLPAYEHIAESKSGELIAGSLALGVAFHDPGRIPRCAQLGRKLGLLYQMLDDLLDYCPGTDTGKPALGDFRQKRWTWPLSEIGNFSFDDSAFDIAEQMCRRRNGSSALTRCVERIDLEAKVLERALVNEFGDADVGISLAREWVSRAREAVAHEETGRRHLVSRRAIPNPTLRSLLPIKENAVGYLAANSKSFRFASRFFAERDLSSVANVYAFCRVTDDLVDKLPPATAKDLLDEWVTLARAAYDGSATGIRFLDRAMTEMRSKDISFDYVSELAEGMRMDLRGERYLTLEDLQRYTYRVASVVGLWLTELAGVRERDALRHAEALGHAMQLTNILRDVGADARAGRLYLPADVLEAYGLSEQDIISAARSRVALDAGFPQMMEALMKRAEQQYDFALAGVHHLPASYRRAVAVAAYVYRGIHSEIRNNSYDTITRRAVTSARGKAMLAARAMWMLYSSSSPSPSPQYATLRGLTLMSTTSSLSGPSSNHRSSSFIHS